MGQYFSNSDALPALDLLIYEFSPLEFGTYHDSIYGFAPSKYLGSRFVNSAVPENETCVLGFDNVGFVTGTSSDIYKGGVDIAVMLTQNVIPEIPTKTIEGAELVAVLTKAVTEYFSAVSSTNSTVDGAAAYDPNLFYQYSAASSAFE
jgi:lysophospholipase